MRSRIRVSQTFCRQGAFYTLTAESGEPLPVHAWRVARVKVRRFAITPKPRRIQRTRKLADRRQLGRIESASSHPPPITLPRGGESFWAGLVFRYARAVHGAAQLARV